MSMVRCSQCGTAFSSYRTACPNCGAERNKGGARLKKKSGPDVRLIITIVLILAVIACIIILATMIFGGDSDAELPDSPPGNGDLIQDPDDDTFIDPDNTQDPDSGNQTGSDNDTDSGETDPPVPSATVDSISLNIQWYESINGYEASFVVGQTFTFRATTSPDTVDVVWASEDSSIMQIDESGNAVAMGQGVTAITATYEDITVKCTVRVN